MDDLARARALKSHARKHKAQQFRRAPLLPFHHVVFDPMHGVHNEANVLLDEATHQHLMVQSSDPEVKAIIETQQAKINAKWKEQQLPKFIQFCRDKQGAHSHALNGPTFKAVWSRPELIIDSIRPTEPVYALLESKSLTPALSKDAVGEGADKGPKKLGGTGKPKKKKQRGVAWDDEEPDNIPPAAPEGEECPPWLSPRDVQVPKIALSAGITE